MSSNALRFEGLAHHYGLYRPGFPLDVFRILAARVADDGPAVALDVGAGVGLSAEGLAAALPQHWRIIAAEPGPDMRDRCAERFRDEPRVSVIGSAAEAIAVGSHSASIVLAARALHWFDADRFGSEARRVIAPRGLLAALFNRIEPYPPFDAMQAFFKTTDGNARPPGSYDRDTFGTLAGIDGFSEPERIEVAWHADLSETQLIEMFFTRSRLKPAIERLGAEAVRAQLAAIVRDVATGAEHHRLAMHAVLGVCTRLS